MIKLAPDVKYAAPPRNLEISARSLLWANVALD